MAQKKSQNALREMVVVKPSATPSTYVGKSTNKQESMAAAIAARRASFASNKTPTIRSK